MRLTVTVACLALLAMLASALVSMRAPAHGDDLVARGRYLVGPAGQCADCHGADLHGSYLGFLKPGMPVVYRSANIAGLKQLSSAAAIKFFETGVLPDGKHAGPPMPEYRYNSTDAAAIVAYLKSLK